jgi:hypothetical protein
MQPTLLDLEHSCAMWTERRRTAACAPKRSPGGRRRVVVELLVALAAWLDRDAARAAPALSAAACRRT